MSAIRILVPLLLAGLLFAQGGQAATPHREMEAALKAFNRGDFDTGIQYLNVLLGSQMLSEPEKALVYAGLGFGWQGKGVKGKALEYFNKAIRIDANNPDAYGMRGKLHVDFKEYDRAVEDFTRVIELRARDYSGYASRGATYFLMKKYESAVADLGRAVELRPGDLFSYFYRALAYGELKQHEKAIADFDAILALEPENLEVLCRRGQALFRLKKPRQAVEDFSRAIALKQDFDWAYYLRSRSLSCLREFDKAIADLEKAIELNGKFAGAHNNLAWLLATCREPGHRDPAKALRHARESLRLLRQDKSGERSEALAYADTLAAVQAAGGQWAKAIETQARVVRGARQAKLPGLEGMERRLALFKTHQPFVDEDECEDLDAEAAD